MAWASSTKIGCGIKLCDGEKQGNIEEHISVLTDIISMNCNVDYAAKAMENNAVKILYDVLVKNNAKEILESTIVCLTKLMEGSDEFKKIAKDTGTLKIFDDFLYKYNNDADLSLKMFNFLQLFVDSPDLPKEALLQSGIVQTIFNYSLEKEQDKTWESTLSCLSGLSESITTDENKLIEKLFKRFIKYNTVIEEEKNQRLIYLSVKIIYDLTKNIERNKEETSKHFKELFNELTNLSNGSPSRELIAKIIRNCILDSKPRLDLFAVTFEQEKMFWPEFTKSVKELNNLVISLNCLWIATKLIIENESSRSELKSKRETVQKDVVEAFIECLQKYSIASEMTDEKWEIIGKTFTACRILDNDVLAQFSVGIGETIRSLTKNNRFDTDHKMRENVEEFITTSGMSGLSKIIVEWSETKKEMLAKPEHRKENSLIEYWR
ncbi:hypothetical protein PRIPAC_83988 [Pristionchus pacificus]|uniref:Uncharacterized protein n=1 Tax=Pristionchus pacificus TaxID=54126 RepID=A0A2A6C4Q2_PRIPA|nr:hypothetical protein PRIPAC_83988 [Pristionchus pacificus]|eukprot:PDM73202.1 hypothetical protein PRIPAC_43298 [Pristionchus pacificus]